MGTIRKYRLYQIDSGGRISGIPYVIEAATDAEVIEQARRLSGGFNIEIWDEARRVGLIERDKNSPPA